jgi:hypothetical protein
VQLERLLERRGAGLLDQDPWDAVPRARDGLRVELVDRAGDDRGVEVALDLEPRPVSAGACGSSVTAMSPAARTVAR